MIGFENMTDEQAQQNLDQLRDHHPINGALQDLALALFHTKAVEGAVTPLEAQVLMIKSEETVTLLMKEIHSLQKENNRLALLVVSSNHGMAGNA